MLIYWTERGVRTNERTNDRFGANLNSTSERASECKAVIESWLADWLTDRPKGRSIGTTPRAPRLDKRCLGERNSIRASGSIVKQYVAARPSSRSGPVSWNPVGNLLSTETYESSYRWDVVEWDGVRCRQLDGDGDVDDKWLVMSRSHKAMPN